MTFRILAPSPTITTLRASQNPGWKIGQVTQGTVSSRAGENPTVKVAGSNYPVNSNLKLTHGEALILKVSANSGQVEFSVVSRAAKNVGNSEASTAVLPDKFLHDSAAANRNLNSSLTNFISLLRSSSTSLLPSATAQLIDSMRNNLIRAKNLVNPELLEKSLLTGSLLLSRHPSSKSLDGDLLGLLKQIVESLAKPQYSEQRIPVSTKYQQALGMTLYLSHNREILQKFTRDIEERHTNLLNLRSKAQDDMQQYAYRLQGEMPVLFRNQLKSISIRFFEKKSESKKCMNSADCGVDFEFEFENGRTYVGILFTNSLVYFSIACANESRAEDLASRRCWLENRLAHCGLKLQEMKVASRDGYLQEVKYLERLKLPVDKKETHEATSFRLRELYSAGKLPQLKEFSLQLNRHDLEIVREIPAELYCAMACFFAVLFDAEPED